MLIYIIINIKEAILFSNLIYSDINYEVISLSMHFNTFALILQIASFYYFQLFLNLLYFTLFDFL